jgi:hypothetical protein
MLTCTYLILDNHQLVVETFYSLLVHFPARFGHSWPTIGDATNAPTDALVDYVDNLTSRVDRRPLDDEFRFEGDGPRHAVEIWRGLQDRVVDLGELLLGAVALDTNRVAQILVTRRGRSDPEKAAEINLAAGLVRKVFRG